MKMIMTVAICGTVLLLTSSVRLATAAEHFHARKPHHMHALSKHGAFQQTMARRSMKKRLITILIHRAIRESFALGWLSRMLATTATRLNPAQLVRIRAAELLVWGEDEVFRTVDYAERFANSIPKGMLVRIRSAGGRRHKH